MKKLVVAIACMTSGIGSIAAAAPVSVSIDAIDAIYNANAPGAYSSGNPVNLALPSQAASFTFATTGMSTVTLNGSTVNDADGVGAAVSSSSNSGTTTISGINAPDAGYLVGVFLNLNAVGGLAPATLTYATTNFTTFAPSLQQVFFIGDGLTGDGTGSSQTFTVPTGATNLFLGFSDAGGYNGAPGSYGDNSGSLSGFVTIATNAVVTPPTGGTVPEPSALALLTIGLLGVGIGRRKR